MARPYARTRSDVREPHARRGFPPVPPRYGHWRSGTAQGAMAFTSIITTLRHYDTYDITTLRHATTLRHYDTFLLSDYDTLRHYDITTLFCCCITTHYDITTLRHHDTLWIYDITTQCDTLRHVTTLRQPRWLADCWSPFVGTD